MEDWLRRMSLRQKFWLLLKVLFAVWTAWMRDQLHRFSLTLNRLATLGAGPQQAMHWSWRDVPIPDPISWLENWLLLFVWGFNAFILIGFSVSLYLALQVGTIPDIARGDQKPGIPQVAVISTSVPAGSVWTGHAWLSQVEARQLRTRPNVVNLAMLDHGGVKYSAGHSISFTGMPTWQRVKPYGISALSVRGTSVELEVENEHYVLNMLQPFVLADRPDHILIVDATGDLWGANMDALELMPIERVLNDLDLQLSPNPTLSLSY